MFAVARGYCRRRINPRHSRRITPVLSEEIRAPERKTPPMRAPHSQGSYGPQQRPPSMIKGKREVGAG